MNAFKDPLPYAYILMVGEKTASVKIYHAITSGMFN